MRVTFWGVRGSVPVPAPTAAGFGGNTSCVEVTTDDGTHLILDAGTGIRALGLALAGRSHRVHILLTHLHLDHIQGLMFFAPLFDPGSEVTIWGPTSDHRPLRERLGRYLSHPLSPLEIRDLPAQVTFEDASRPPWRIGDVEIKAALVAHRGPHHRGGAHAVLPARSRAGVGRGSDHRGPGLDLRLRDRPRRVAADPRLPVRRRRVPHAARVGAFAAIGRLGVRASRSL